MADDDNGEDEDGPVVELGESESIEGVPLARATSRLTWGMEKSRLERRIGDTEIRTPEGPRRIDDVLDEIDETYFERRQEFESHVHEVVGTGPVPTTDE
ncbi:DUF5789 family protein [Halococcus saccharolyticus]|uniref:Uncharacterized protein n=1 Tax=Halococcus saccharolyticus DSM 5350 TaxID=1227455 RepID=M0MTG6_9EURY|nr:DUF5789 family protein [Halococcus saccharolyticus]EMA48029.1 hypothetical protein C449_00060 [Halococcus saccharolyticus DSM 5350]